MRFPSNGKVLAISGREAGMVEDELGTGALGIELEAYDGKDAGFPTGLAPCLNDALVGYQLELPANDVVAEDAECAAGLAD